MHGRVPGIRDSLSRMYAPKKIAAGRAHMASDAEVMIQERCRGTIDNCCTSVGALLLASLHESKGLITTRVTRRVTSMAMDSLSPI